MRDCGRVEQFGGRGNGQSGHGHRRFEPYAGNRHVRLGPAIAIHNDNGDFFYVHDARIFFRLFFLIRLLIVSHLRSRKRLPRQALHIGDYINLPVAGLGVGQQRAGPLKRNPQVGPFVADAGRGQNLPRPFVRTVQPSLFWKGRASAEKQGDLVAVFELVEDLSSGLLCGFKTRAALVDGTHAGRIVQYDCHNRPRSGAQQRGQAGERGRGQAYGDEHEHGRADEHQQQVVNALFAARFLYADLQETQRAEENLLRLLTIDHMQHDRNNSGHCGDQK